MYNVLTYTEEVVSGFGKVVRSALKYIKHHNNQTSNPKHSTNKMLK